MLNMKKIERLIELSLLSGYVKDDTAPLSLILISYPETAKTSMILKFDCPHTIETTDLSSKPIVDVIVPKLHKNELHHILIPDMTKMLAHRETTVKACIGFLNALMEEGIKHNLFFGQNYEFEDRKRCGLVTAVTFDFYYKMFRQWYSIGFVSRFLPVSFKYSNQTVIDIHESIKNNIIYDDIVKMKKIQTKHIEIPKEIGEWISLQSQSIAEKQSNESIRVKVQSGKQQRITMEVYGFRLHKQLRKLSKSIALSYKEKTVTWTHLNEMKSLLDYIRMPKNPKVI